MRLNIRKLCVLVLFTLTLTVSVNATVVMKPNLYGKILLITSSGTVPLREATVELISPNTGKVLYRTYTDPHGNFSFYNVAEGPYEIQILLDKKPMKQQAGDKVIERCSVKVLSQPTSVPDILILLK